mmetsp:Transcript_21724/g.67438  ORF Transcript_21724/g.67438 Transcript_21724/m.67438 type:complete len:93 (-) Transcript_21724:213-491(-)
MGQSLQCCDKRDKEAEGGFSLPSDRTAFIPLAQNDQQGGYGPRAPKMLAHDDLLILPPISTPRSLEWPTPTGESPRTPPTYRPLGTAEIEVL